MSNKTFSVAMAMRTLSSPADAICEQCSSASAFRHGERCPASRQHPTQRHDAVKHLHASLLRRLPRTKVRIEPFVTTGDSEDRTDLRVSGDGAPDGVVVDLDFAVHSTATLASQQRLAQVDSSAAPQARISTTLDSFQNLLQVKSQEKVARYTGRTPGAFATVLLTSGGLLHESTATLWDHWRKLDSHFSIIITHLLVILAKFRSFAYIPT